MIRQGFVFLESRYELAQPVCQPVRGIPQERGKRDVPAVRQYRTELRDSAGPHMVFQLGPDRSKRSWRIRRYRKYLQM